MVSNQLFAMHVRCTVCDEPLSTFIQVWTPSRMASHHDSICLCDPCITKIADLAAQDRGGKFDAGPSLVRRLWRQKVSPPPLPQVPGAMSPY